MTWRTGEHVSNRFLKNNARVGVVATGFDGENVFDHLVPVDFGDKDPYDGTPKIVWCLAGILEHRRKK